MGQVISDPAPVISNPSEIAPAQPSFEAPPPPASLDDAYALQRKQAEVDADAGGEGWDTGSLGGTKARDAVRAALLRDHEAAIERDRSEHASAVGGHSTEHSAAHHHDA